jgi:hypothetical protein
MQRREIPGWALVVVSSYVDVERRAWLEMAGIAEIVVPLEVVAAKPAERRSNRRRDYDEDPQPFRSSRCHAAPSLAYPSATAECWCRLAAHEHRGHA